MKRLLLFLYILLISTVSFSQRNTTPASFCISSDEKALFNFINTLRKDNNKKALKLSKTLSYVANIHVGDLLENHPDTSICNLSSWSNKGKWTPCCYNPYLPKPLCIKRKPKELTNYPYYGYEFVFYFEDEFPVDSIIRIFSETDEIKDMILTSGKWKEKKWVIAGVGINKHYASVWFSQKPDNIKPPSVCKKEKNDVKTKKPDNNEVIYYYVINLSFTDIVNAKEALKRTRKNGFNDAGIIESEGNYRLYLHKFKSAKEALRYKNGLPETYKKSWVFKK